MFHSGPPNRPRRVWEAWLNGWAAGLEEHLPKGVGILITGIAVCALLALLHFALGIRLDDVWVARGLGW